MSIQIEQLEAQHYEAVRAIYLEGISTDNATFEVMAPDWAEWDKKHFPHSRLVAIRGKSIVGWAALTPVSERCAYGGVAEVSIYLTISATGRGIGTQLMNALIDVSEKNGIWTLQSGIFPENESSIKLHLKTGFRMVGYRERIGILHGHWRNTVLMERRSPKVGTKH